MIALVLVLSLGAPALPAAASPPGGTAAPDTIRTRAERGPLRWRATAHHSIESLRGDVPNWSVRGLQLQRRFARGSLAVELGQAERRGLTDPRVAADAYLDLWPRAYGNVRYQHVARPDVLPGHDVFAEVYQALPGGWEASAGYRLMAFPADRVHLFSAGLARYLGSWYLRGRGAVIPRGGTVSATGALSARRYVGAEARSFYELSAGRGREAIPLGQGGQVSIRQSWFGAARVQWLATAHLGASVSASYTADAALTRWGVGLGLLTRW